MSINQKSKQIFTFSSTEREDPSAQYARKELERAVEFLQRQITELDAKLAELGSKNNTVVSVFGRTGRVAALKGDYSFDQLANIPSTLAGYRISDALKKTESLDKLSTASLGDYGLKLLSYINQIDASKDLDIFVPLLAGEDLDSGDFVNISTGFVLRASVADLKPAQGFVREATSTGYEAKVRTSSFLNGFTGLMIGTDYYLSDINPGRLTATPTTSGFVQHLGVASAADVLLTIISDPVYFS